MIREIQAEDREAARGLLSALFQEIDPESVLFAAEASSITTDLYLSLGPEKSLGLVYRENPNESARLSSLLLARVEERPLRSRARAVYIDAAYTLPDFRGRGRMTFLLDRLEIWSNDRGIEVMELSTPLANQTARVFWEKRGYIPRMLTFSRERERGPQA